MMGQTVSNRDPDKQVHFSLFSIPRGCPHPHSPEPLNIHHPSTCSPRGGIKDIKDAGKIQNGITSTLWPALGHMATPICKGCWEMESLF